MTDYARHEHHDFLGAAQQGGGNPQPLLHSERVSRYAVSGTLREPDQFEEITDPLERRRRTARCERSEVLAR